MSKGAWEKDPELLAYRDTIGANEYNRQYKRLYVNTNKSDKRYSGRKYENTEEKLLQLREKYRNGVTLKDIKEMFEK